MIVEGRDYPYVSACMDVTGILRIKVDFELYPTGWAHITLLNEDLEKLQRGEEITAKFEIVQTPLPRP